MLSSGIIDLAIGLAFIFGVTAALSSVVTELIARFLGLRGAYLLSALRELVDGGAGDSGADNVPATVLGNATTDYDALKTYLLANAPAQPGHAAAGPGNPPAAAAAPPAESAEGGAGRQAQVTAEAAEPKLESATGALLGSPLLRSQGMAGQISTRNLTLQPGERPGPATMTMSSAGSRLSLWGERRSLPSYIPARSFAEAIIDLLVPDAEGQTEMGTVQRSVSALPESMPALKSSLLALATNAGDDIGLFRESVENWYDDHMDRVSGWYKRHVAKITLAVGTILVLLLNINALTIGRTLYTDSTLSAAVSSVAAKGTTCPAGQTQQGCLATLEAELSGAATAGLPIGWGTVRACAVPTARCNWLQERGILSPGGGSGWQVVIVLIGFLITITALVPGARFWFGLLGKLGSLSTTGPKPATPASQ